MNKNTIKAPCTILLAAVNVIVFLVLSFLGMTEDGEFMLKHGAMYVPYLIQRGEYYRLFSSMFLHFGYDHLVNNMIVLVTMGWNLELDIGKVKFLIVYFVSGLAGMFCRHGGIYRPEVWLYRRERPVLSLGSLEHFCMWQSVTEDGLETYPAEAWSL